MSQSRSEKGFTLIELMIGVAIMAMLLLLAMPFTRDWIDSNRQLQARSVLWEAIAHARAIALRNPSGVADSAMLASSLQRNGTLLQVTAADSDAVLWSGNVPDSAVLKLAGTSDFADVASFNGSPNEAFACLAFNSRGQHLAAAHGCLQSNTTLSRIAIGLNDQDPLYVDML